MESFECERCGASFTRKQHLIVHLQKRTKCFPTVADVNCDDYIIKLKSVTRTRVFPCSVCKQKFARQSDARTHAEVCKNERQTAVSVVPTIPTLPTVPAVPIILTLPTITSTTNNDGGSDKVYEFIQRLHQFIEEQSNKIKVLEEQTDKIKALEEENKQIKKQLADIKNAIVPVVSNNIGNNNNTTINTNTIVNNNYNITINPFGKETMDHIKIEDIVEHVKHYTRTNIKWNTFKMYHTCS